MQITTITFFKYGSLLNKIWAFGMMQFAHRALQGVQGQSFYKLMGSGKGFGFNPLPDWSVYCLLQVWESEEHADTFFMEADLMKGYRKHTVGFRTFYMKTYQQKGNGVIEIHSHRVLI